MAGEMWLTVQEAAAFFGVSEQTVRDWVKKGRLKGKRIGGRWMVDASSARSEEAKLDVMAEARDVAAKVRGLAKRPVFDVNREEVEEALRKLAFALIRVVERGCYGEAVDKREVAKAKIGLEEVIRWLG